MHKYDYSFLEDGKLSARLFNLVSGIVSLNTAKKFKSAENKEIFTELEKISRIQSVKGSNAIEGIVTSDERIAAIVSKTTAPLNHDELEIAGYSDALDIVHTSFEHLKFDEDTLLMLHAEMLKFSDSDYVGHYKKDENIILAIDKQGRRSVRFKPVASEDVKDNMEQLIFAYMEANSNSKINKLLLIPCVIQDFLCIHPFSDGNGRISRLASLLLLYKAGFDIGRYISFEAQINKNKNAYYDALQNSSIGWHENKNEYSFFILDFLKNLYQCYVELDKRFAIVDTKKLNKSERIEAIVLKSLTPMSKKDICNILPDISPTTIEYVLGNLVKNKKINKLNKGRSTKYISAKFSL